MINISVPDLSPDVTLPALARQMNAIAVGKESLRLEWLKRLAVAYLIVVGHRPAVGPPREAKNDGSKFYAWAAQHLVSGTGRAYPYYALRKYVTQAFSANPAAQIAAVVRDKRRNGIRASALGGVITRAIKTELPPAAATQTITRTFKRLNPSADVQAELRALVAAWEGASPEARRIFVHDYAMMAYPPRSK